MVLAMLTRLLYVTLDEIFRNTKMLNLLRHRQQITTIRRPNLLNHGGAWNLTPAIAASVAGLWITEGLLIN